MKTLLARWVEMIKSRPRLSAWVGFLVVSLAALYPRSIYLMHFPTDDLTKGDAGMYFWNFWWTLRCLSEGRNIFQTYLLFYPEGAELYFHILHLFNSLFVLPFQAAGIPQLGYNLFVLASAVLSGWGVYTLARDMEIRSEAAFLAGALFILCPYRFGHLDLNHFDLQTTFVIPCYLLWMRRAMIQPGWKAPVLWALWLLISWNITGYYMVFLIIISIPFWLWIALEMRNKIRLKEVLQRSLLAVGIFILVFMPQFMMMLKAYDKDKTERPLGAAVYWSADLLCYVIPPFIGRTLAEMNPAYMYSLGGEGEFSVFPGIALYALVIWIVWHGRVMQGRFWVLLALVALILSLGPALKVVKLVEIPPVLGMEKQGYALLPAYLLQKIPLLGAIRGWARWSVFFQLALIFLVATNFGKLEDLWSKKTRLSGYWFIGLIILLTFLENKEWNLPHSPAQPPEIFVRLAKESPLRTVLHLPNTDTDPEPVGLYMYLQTLNGLPMCNGYTSFETRPEKLVNRPLMRFLDLLDPDVTSEEITTDLYELNLGWIVLHRRYFPSDEEYLLVKKLVQVNLRAEFYGQNRFMEIYRIPLE